MAKFIARQDLTVEHLRLGGTDITRFSVAILIKAMLGNSARSSPPRVRPLSIYVISKEHAALASARHVCGMTIALILSGG